jgi:hypothetical protein
VQLRSWWTILAEKSPVQALQLAIHSCATSNLVVSAHFLSSRLDFAAEPVYEALGRIACAFFKSASAMRILA